jgi:hypothetical protein
MLNAQFAEVLADRTAKIATKGSGKMYGMDAYFLGHGVQRYLASVSAPENINGPSQPRRLPATIRAECLPRQMTYAL